MPPSADISLNSAADYAMDAPLAFRRQRFWFLNFVMTPFKDIDQRAVLDPTHEPRTRGR